MHDYRINEILHAFDDDSYASQDIAQAIESGHEFLHFLAANDTTISW